MNAWIKFQVTAQNEKDLEENPILLMFNYEDLIRAIRKDLGHKNNGLAKGKVLSLFVNDMAKFVDENGDIKPPSKPAEE